MALYSILMKNCLSHTVQKFQSSHIDLTIYVYLSHTIVFIWSFKALNACSIVLGFKSRDKICVAEICIDGFEFGEINETENYKGESWDGLLGLHGPNSVSDLFEDNNGELQFHLLGVPENDW